MHTFICFFNTLYILCNLQYASIAFWTKQLFASKNKYGLIYQQHSWPASHLQPGGVYIFLITRNISVFQWKMKNIKALVRVCFKASNMSVSTSSSNCTPLFFSQCASARLCKQKRVSPTTFFSNLPNTNTFHILITLCLISTLTPLTLLPPATKTHTLT